MCVRRAIRRSVCAPLILAAMVLFSRALLAQDTGETEVAIESHTIADTSQPSLSAFGVAVASSQYVPHLGLFSTNVEGYGSNDFRAGTLLVSLQGAPWVGWHWDLVGGDFHVSLNLAANAFVNIYAPDILGRGVLIGTRRAQTGFELFAGESEAQGGYRIPFRILLPQRVLGGAAQQSGRRWQFSARLLRLSTDPSAFLSASFPVAPSRQFQQTDSLTLQASTHLTDHLNLFSELSYARASTRTAAVDPARELSWMFGPSWERHDLTLRANYVQQGAMYLPLLGYSLGDRTGPYGEARYRPAAHVELYGSASEYRNNIEHQSDVSTFVSRGYTTGAAVSLPHQINLGASLTTVDFTEHNLGNAGELSTHNRQLSVSFGVPVGRHSLRASVVDMNLTTNVSPQTQRTLEVADTFTWRRLTLGGAIRDQHAQSSETRDTLFVRGSISTNTKRLSMYAYLEKGNDLINRSIFTTNASTSTVAGFSAPLVRQLNVQVEAYRNTLNTALNPVNVFLLSSAAVGPNTLLDVLSQWSIYVRLSRKFRWGHALPPETSLAQYAAERTLLFGTVEGMVVDLSGTGSRGAANVTVTLDTSREVLTDGSGHYVFSRVSEGTHDVAIDLDRLPANFDPGPTIAAHIDVAPRGMVRTNLEVVRLTSLSGRIFAPAGTALESLVIRLKGTARYTTPSPDGSFRFSNLREGAYVVALDRDTLPADRVEASPVDISVQIANDRANPLVLFELRQVLPVEKPLRDVPQPDIHLLRR